TRDLLVHLSRRSDVAAFISVEVLKGGRELLTLREHLRCRAVASLRDELARFDGDAVASDLQVEMLVATMTHLVVREVETGRTPWLPEVLEPALALADACEPMHVTT